MIIIQDELCLKVILIYNSLRFVTRYSNNIIKKLEYGFIFVETLYL